jgi:hypothetical protein
MAPTVTMSASVKTRLNVILKKGRVSAHRVGQGYIATRRVRRGHLARTASITVLVNPAMSRNVVISRLGNVFANLVT